MLFLGSCHIVSVFPGSVKKTNLPLGNKSSNPKHVNGKLTMDKAACRVNNKGYVFLTSWKIVRNQLLLVLYRSVKNNPLTSLNQSIKGYENEELIYKSYMIYFIYNRLVTYYIRREKNASRFTAQNISKTSSWLRH